MGWGIRIQLGAEERAEPLSTQSNRERVREQESGNSGYSADCWILTYEGSKLEDRNPGRELVRAFDCWMEYVH